MRDHRHHHGARGPRHEGLHDGPHGPGRRGPRGRRASRGHLRHAILTLLGEGPMHGYQLMQAIAERTDGRWSPSPGAIYPTLSQLEDEGLVSVAAESGRRVVSLTEEGRRVAQQLEEAGGDPFAEAAGPRGSGVLREAMAGLVGAVREVARGGEESQVEGAAAILRDARRRLYLLLAEESSPQP